ncbi:MAG: diguanylate cyclase domain-containing protein, partial [Halanaerobiaceae bacterium]
MVEESFSANNSDDLRNKAEKILDQSPKQNKLELEEMSADEIRQIFHELQVHQIELELQNEELRAAQSQLEAARARYYDLYNLAPVGYCTLTEEGLILEANLTACELLDRKRQELVQQSISNFIFSDDQDDYYFFRKRLLETGQPQDCELRILDKEENTIWVSLHASLVEDDDKPKIRIVLIDINERKQARKASKTREKRQKLAVEIASDFLSNNINMMDVTIDGTIERTLLKIGKELAVDRSYVFKLTEEEQIFSGEFSWYDSGVDFQIPEEKKFPVEVPPFMYEQLLEKKAVSVSTLDELPERAVETRKELKKQSIKSLLWVPMVVEDYVLGFVGVDCVQSSKEWTDNDVITMKMITSILASAIKRNITEENLIQQTFHDQLTGLFNRTFFKEEIKRMNVKRQMPISLIMADVNSLKLINDTFGHEKGDQLLKKVSNVFTKVCRKEDVVTRWGGDEFIILLPQTKEEVAQKICDRIRKECSQIENFDIPVSVALGYAIKEKVEDNIHDCIQQAEKEMYKNKLNESMSVKGNVLKTMLNNLERKSHETGEHAQRLKTMAQKIGEELDLSDTKMNQLFLAVTMHDIGKTRISEDLLFKKGKLTETERNILQKHSERGYRIAASTEEFAPVAKVILHHHEWWDGSGYPEGLAGEEIPLLSRIIGLVDAYDVMTSDRSYSSGPQSHKEAIAELKRCAGIQFDPQLVEIFVHLFEEGEL